MCMVLSFGMAQLIERVHEIGILASLFTIF